MLVVANFEIISIKIQGKIKEKSKIKEDVEFKTLTRIRIVCC